jgi:hypothetical protein
MPYNKGVVKNLVESSRNQKDIEEDEENDVNLETTMWLIIRKKESVNPILKNFCP